MGIKFDNTTSKVIVICFALFIIGLVSYISSDNYKASEAVRERTPIVEEEFNGLKVTAYDVKFPKNTDTGKIVLKASIQIDNSKETSFKLSTPIFSGYELEAIDDKITGGKTFDGYLKTQTNATKISDIKKRTLRMKAYDMSNDDWTYIDLKIPDKYFKE